VCFISGLATQKKTSFPRIQKKPIPMRAKNSKRLTVLSEDEKLALYSLPDFDDFQRAEYLGLPENELTLALLRRKDLPAQVYCLLQIGYFKAKQTFFRFSLEDVPQEDVAFALQRYFPGMTLVSKSVSQPEYYEQRNEIIRLFGYRLCAETDRREFTNRAAQLARRDVTPTFILTELLAHLETEKIVRPGYTTLQKIIIEALATERLRLEQFIDAALDDNAQRDLQKLLLHEDTLSELGAHPEYRI
jgi:hypothetical protein